MGAAVTANKGRHYIPPTGGGPEGFHRMKRWVRERYGKAKYPGLFMYYHKGAGNWVVAEWVNRDAGVFQEILCVGPRADVFSPSMAAELGRRLSESMDPRTLDRRLREAEYNWNHRMTQQSLGQMHLKEKIIRDAHPGAGNSRRSHGFGGV